MKEIRIPKLPHEKEDLIIYIYITDKEWGEWEKWAKKQKEKENKMLFGKQM